MSTQSVALAITGASGAAYGLRLLEVLLAKRIRVHLVISAPGRIVIAEETDLRLPSKANEICTIFNSRFNAQPGDLQVYGREDWFAPIASGSNPPDAMVICPCTTGTLAEVASSIGTGGRVPWVDEPKCGDDNCHTTGMGSDNDDAALYRNSTGHGGMSCPACHGSPHAMLPSDQYSDGYQARQYQGSAITIGSCAVCHSSSRGDGSSEFLEEHGSGGRASACNVCHTSVTSDQTTEWPHQFSW